ncbi:MAG: SH3 domain-containing protein [Lachnospiraceae bacterium]|nr:SH3 domain-containing protein [Lachnospiraceae bacterium]
MRKGIRYVLTLVALVAAFGMFGGDLNQALAATITVTDGPCRIRSDASTTSEAISSVDNGKKLDVLGEVTASDGYTWYKVKVEGDKTGYIRADLVSTPDGSVSSSDSSSKTETKKEETKTETKKEETKTETKKEETKKEETKSEPEPAAEVVESDAVTGSVSADSVTVRSNASTKSDKKASAGNGQEVTITGEATGSDGKTWYQVSYEDNGKSIEGFIRSDFLTVTATKADQEAEEEPVEEEVPEVPETPAVSNDYEVKYEANSEGIEEWFLYDHINGTKQSINNIHDVMQQSLNPVVDDRGEVKTMKIIIIVMAVIMLLLIAAVAILLFRLRDSYEDFGDIDDDYDEDEEDEEEIEEMDDEEDDYDRRRRAPRQKKGFLGRGRNRDYDESEDEEEDDEDEEEEEVYTRPVRRTRTPERSERRSASRGDDGAWSSRSLSDIDDDMEFEFLDLDN